VWRRDLFSAEEERLTRSCNVMLTRSELWRAAECAGSDGEATNGVAWVDQPGLDLIALIPQWVMRPWTLHHRTGSTAIISYPVADESLGQNGGAVTARRSSWRAFSPTRAASRRSAAGIGTADLQELADKLA